MTIVLLPLLLEPRKSALTVHFFHPLCKHFFHFLYLFRSCLYLFLKLLILKHIVWQSFTYFFYFKPFNFFLIPFLFPINKLFVHQLIVIQVEFRLNPLLTKLVRYVLNHHTKISSSNGAVIHHPLISNLTPVYHKQTNHPHKHHTHQQPSFNQ